MADPILPLGIFTAVADAYMPSLTTDPSRDPLISPYFAHDKLLRYGSNLLCPYLPWSLALSAHNYLPSLPPSLLSSLPPSFPPSVVSPPPSSAWVVLILS